MAAKVARSKKNGNGETATVKSTRRATVNAAPAKEARRAQTQAKLRSVSHERYLAETVAAIERIVATRIDRSEEERGKWIGRMVDQVSKGNLRWVNELREHFGLAQLSNEDHGEPLPSIQGDDVYGMLLVLKERVEEPARLLRNWLNTFDNDLERQGESSLASGILRLLDTLSGEIDQAGDFVGKYGVVPGFNPRFTGLPDCPSRFGAKGMTPKEWREKWERRRSPTIELKLDSWESRVWHDGGHSGLRDLRQKKQAEARRIAEETGKPVRIVDANGCEVERAEVALAQSSGKE